MANKNDGVQKLLAAEKKGAELVNEARKRKVQKLKNSKKESDVEINNFKMEKDNEFKKYEQEILGRKSTNETQVQLQTNQKLKDLEGMMKNNRGKAMKSILEALLDIQVRVHENYRY